ncbi:chorismate mutase [Clostridium oryzae]|uniref:Intracellular chorismate mutase n=1 Tax=Clostridium oryzae TaxID=1450648 RepID=A0A1V4IBS7_9CLOT|nr:chorismate mutase [Clostridium oryzae]OPJ57396.1 intracellular chorismate mutase [Clostridium oryzae]
MNKLDELRDEIDKLDTEILSLLEKRFAACKGVGEYKLENELPILNEEREQQVIEKILKKIKDPYYSDYIKQIFITIMDESKKLQKNL